MQSMPDTYFGDSGLSDSGRSVEAWIRATAALAVADIVMRLVSQRDRRWRFVGNSDGMSNAPRRGVRRRRGLTHDLVAVVGQWSDAEGWQLELGHAAWWSVFGLINKPTRHWTVIATYDSRGPASAEELWESVVGLVDSL